MISSPLDNTHSWKTSGMACPRCPWAKNTIGQSRAWYVIIFLKQQHCQMTSGVTCHHSPWATYKVIILHVWHTLMVLGQHTRSANIRHRMPSSPLGSKRSRPTSGVATLHRPWAAHTIGRHRAWHAIISLESIHSRTTLGVACYHYPWAAHIIGQHQAWHSPMALG